MRDALIAAADIAEGAMIALVPSAADCERLAVEGGEPVDQLHLTLVYLGDAVDFDDADRAALISAGEDMVKGWESVAGEVDSFAWFNPTGDEPCLVMLCSGVDLAEIYETCMADVTEIVELPGEIKVPWRPHVTLIYTSDDAMQYSDTFVDAGRERVGPITFDRLRLAFGSVVTDIPIGAPLETPAVLAVEPDATTVEEALPQAPGPPAVVASAREVWDGCPRGVHDRHTGECPPAL